MKKKDTQKKAHKLVTNTFYIWKGLEPKTRYSLSVFLLKHAGRLHVLPDRYLQASKEDAYITKTRLFKYIENFTTKKTESFQIKILTFFIFLLKT